MSFNYLGSESAAVVAVIDPDVTAASTVNSDGVDMSLYDNVSFILCAGTLGSNATLDMAVKSGSDNSTFGTTVKSSTQMTQAGTDASDKQAVVNISAQDLTEGDRYVRAEVTVGTATSDVGMVAIGFNPKHAPASDNDLSSFDEILSS